MNKEKKSRKEIEISIRQKLAHQYNEKVKHYSESADFWNKKYQEEVSKRIKLEHENEILKEQLTSQNDWIERMQEFVNMPDDMRRKEFEKMKQDQESSAKFRQFMDSPFIKMYQHLFNL